MLTSLTLAFLLTGCVEDVATDKVEAVVEDVEPAEPKAKEPAPAGPAGSYVSAPMSRWLLVAMVFVPVLANALLSQVRVRVTNPNPTLA